MIFSIYIYITKFEEALEDHKYSHYLSLLPKDQQDRNSRFVRWQDRHSNLFGKLLLLAGLKNYGYSDEILNCIQYNQYSRPFIDGKIDFNISHSGEYVLCAIGEDLRLGIDVEEIEEINFDDFEKVMTTEQWQKIKLSEDSTQTFFKYWTIKESVIKADSRGLSIPLMDIHVKENNVRYDNQTWYLNLLNLNKNYSAYLTTNKKDININTKYIDFYNPKDAIWREYMKARYSITNYKLSND